MAVILAQWLVIVLQLYLAVGLLFALVFLWRGAGRIDPVAAEGTLGFKILVFPGCVALWPLLARRLLSGRQAPPDETNPHREAARQEAAR